MFKNILLTSAAALAITVGATSISTPDANAGVKINLSFGGGGYYGGYGGYGGYGYGYGHGYGHGCGGYKKLIKYWHAGHGHMHKKWVWKSYC